MPFSELNIYKGYAVSGRRLRYACAICGYAPSANNHKTHIATEEAGLPPHAFLKEDFVAINHFHSATVKTAFVFEGFSPRTLNVVTIYLYL